MTHTFRSLMLSMAFACAFPLSAQTQADSLRIVATTTIARAYDAMYANDHAMALALLDELIRKPELHAYRQQISLAQDSVQRSFLTYNCRAYCHDALRWISIGNYRKGIRAFKAARQYAQTDVERDHIRIALKHTRRARNKRMLWSNAVGLTAFLGDVFFETWATEEIPYYSTHKKTLGIGLTEFYRGTQDKAKAKRQTLLNP